MRGEKRKIKIIADEKWKIGNSADGKRGREINFKG